VSYFQALEKGNISVVQYMACIRPWVQSLVPKPKTSKQTETQHIKWQWKHFKGFSLIFYFVIFFLPNGKKNNIKPLKRWKLYCKYNKHPTFEFGFSYISLSFFQVHISCLHSAIVHVSLWKVYLFRVSWRWHWKVLLFIVWPTQDFISVKCHRSLSVINPHK
jgi:hypothetical protein